MDVATDDGTERLAYSLTGDLLTIRDNDESTTRSRGGQATLRPLPSVEEPTRQDRNRDVIGRLPT